MENYTFNSLTLQLEGLKVTQASMYPLFFFFLVSYLFIMVANVGILVLVCVEKSLHQPMYLLFCNLPFNDILGNSVLLPRLLSDIFTPPSMLLISYYECVLQAFTTHMFSTASHTVLIIMAFDRYVAICKPLRYAAIMTNRMVLKLSASAWGVAFVLVGILLGLTIRLSRCRTLITNPYCDNASLFKLSCESVLINNIYGLAFSVVLLTASIGSMVITYSEITLVCLSSKNQALNSKALKTCSTHLLVYLAVFFCGMLVIILHRFPQYSDQRKMSAILFNIIPGSLNPVIYGVQSKEVQKFMSRLFKSRKEFVIFSREYRSTVAVCYREAVRVRFTIHITMATSKLHRIIWLTVRADLQQLHILPCILFWPPQVIHPLPCPDHSLLLTYTTVTTVTVSLDHGAIRPSAVKWSSLGQCLLSAASFPAVDRTSSGRCWLRGPRSVLSVGTRHLLVAHISTFKALHVPGAGIHHVVSQFVLDTERHVQCLRWTVQKHEHLSTQRLNMSQLGIPTTQTHCPEPARKLPKTLKLYLQSLVGNKRGDARHGNPDRRDRLRGNLNKLIFQDHQILIFARPNKKFTRQIFLRCAAEYLGPKINNSSLKLSPNPPTYCFKRENRGTFLDNLARDVLASPQPDRKHTNSLKCDQYVPRVCLWPRPHAPPPLEIRTTFLYGSFQLPPGDEPGANTSDRLDSLTPASIALFKTFTDTAYRLLFGASEKFHSSGVLKDSRSPSASPCSSIAAPIDTSGNPSSWSSASNALLKEPRCLFITSSTSLSMSFIFRLMENYTFNSLTLQLEGLKVTQASMYPLFFFFLVSYLFIMVANVGIVVLVCVEKSLHQPMYLLFCNLPVNDVLGNSVLLPRLLSDILTPPSKLLISYSECVLQAFTTHMFGTTSHTVLMIMAFDRYVAICKPLHYAAIMTNRMIIKLTASAWGVAFVLVGVLLGLTIRLSRCRTLITNPYCDNPSLFKLSCESVLVNNIYGLAFSVVLLTASIGSMVITYSKITLVCLSSRNQALNSKALQTCSTHLLMYMVVFFCGMLVIALHRYPQYSDQRKMSAILFHIIPGSLNPVIYGVQSKEVQKFMYRLFRSRKVLTSS
ncbi:uncharacterized protein ACNS7B_017277 [Menidia menidia]